MDEREKQLRERLQRIYSDTTIEHILHPHNANILANPDGFAARGSGHGESLRIWLHIRNEIVIDSGFWTDGCAATIACGSMATDLVKGKSVAQALEITAGDIADALINLPEGNFHCAELAANTLKAALNDHLSIQQQPWKRLYRK
jgi:nitrogen fixation NifU-like protein